MKLVTYRAEQFLIGFYASGYVLVCTFCQHNVLDTCEDHLRSKKKASEKGKKELTIPVNEHGKNGI